jgi:hypothetical protein
MDRRFELRNLATAPASDDALVEALLEFANGAEIIIVGQPGQAEPRSRAADRPLYIELLEDANSGKGILPMLTDHGGRQRPALHAIRLGRRNDSLPAPIRGLRSVSVERIVICRPRGYALAYFRKFRSVGAALAEATMLILDPDKPYARALSRCKYPPCRKFYFSRKNPRGGPANRTYCDPEHRRLHNNSALGKQGL